MYEILGLNAKKNAAPEEFKIYDDKANNTEFKLETPKLTFGEDIAGSLTFKMPPTHPNKDKLLMMKTNVVVRRDGEVIWAGRILEVKMDMWDQKEVTCEGVLGYFNDTLQSPSLLKETVAYDPEKILKQIVDKHNQQVMKYNGGGLETMKTFKVGTVDASVEGEEPLEADDEDTNWYTDWNTSWNAIDQILLQRYPAAHLRCQWRQDTGESYPSWHIDFLSKDHYTKTKQKIEFGKNLIEFTRNWDVSELATVCLPRGAVIDDGYEYIDGLNRRLGVTTVNNIENGEPADYNDQFIRITQAVPTSTALDDFGWVAREVQWDEVVNKDKLKKRAKKWLREEQFDDMTIELKAIDMHYFDIDIKSVDILTKIQCVSPPHGMDREFPVTKIEIELDKPENSKIYLGSSKQRTFTGSTVGTSSKTDKEISDIWKKIDNLKIPDPSEMDSTYPSWSTSSWSDILTALQMHYAGAIDLENDYGWRIGDTRRIWINGDYSMSYKIYDKRNTDGTAKYAAPRGYYDFTLLAKGHKRIQKYKTRIVSADDYGGLGPEASGYNVYQDIPGTAIETECAFIVGITSGWNPTNADAVYGFGQPVRDYSSTGRTYYDQCLKGIPYDQYSINPEDANMTNYRWPTCWLRDFLNLRLFSAIAFGEVFDWGGVIGEKAPRFVKSRIDDNLIIYPWDIFKPIVTSYHDNNAWWDQPYVEGSIGVSSSEYGFNGTVWKTNVEEFMSHKVKQYDRVSIPTLNEVGGTAGSMAYYYITDTDENSPYYGKAIPFDIDTIEEAAYGTNGLGNRFNSYIDPMSSVCWTRTQYHRNSSYVTPSYKPYKKNIAVPSWRLDQTSGGHLYPIMVDRSKINSGASNEGGWQGSGSNTRWNDYAYALPYLCI